MEEKEVSSFHSLRPEVTTASLNVESKNGKLFYFFSFLGFIGRIANALACPPKKQYVLGNQQENESVFFLVFFKQRGRIPSFFLVVPSRNFLTVRDSSSLH